MGERDAAGRAENGRVIFPDRIENVGDAPWTPHPVFPGVWLKRLVAGADTAGAMSCHLVKVEPGRALSAHVHPDNGELHEVVGGRGTARLGRRTTEYLPGAAAVIPKGTEHEVLASDEGLFLFAKFFPALV